MQSQGCGTGVQGPGRGGGGRAAVGRTAGRAAARRPGGRVGGQRKSCLLPPGGWWQVPPPPPWRGRHMWSQMGPEWTCGARGLEPPLPAVQSLIPGHTDGLCCLSASRKASASAPWSLPWLKAGMGVSWSCTSSDRFLVGSKTRAEKEGKGLGHPGFLFLKNMMPYLYTGVHSGTIHSGQEREATQVSING